jgi:hypothetical protein
MPPRGVRAYPPRRRPRRTVWSSINTTSQVIAAAATSNVDLLGPLDVAGGSVLGLTVVRTHLRIVVQNFAAAADEILVGTCVLPNEDVGTTVNRASNMGRPWAFYNILVPAASGATVNAVADFDFDIKAMRRIPAPDASYLLCWMNNSAASKTVTYLARTLVKLP